MFGAFKKLFSKSPSSPEMVAPSAPPAPTAPAISTPPAMPPAPKPVVAAPSAPLVTGDIIHLPLTEIIKQLPANMAGLVVAPPSGTFALPVNGVMEQLRAGAVRMPFGQLRKEVPPGIFADSTTFDESLIDLPLGAILAALGPRALTRRQDQVVVDVPDSVTGVFGPKNTTTAKVARINEPPPPPPAISPAIKMPEKPKPVPLPTTPASPLPTAPVAGPPAAPAAAVSSTPPPSPAIKPVAPVPPIAPAPIKMPEITKPAAPVFPTSPAKPTTSISPASTAPKPAAPSSAPLPFASARPATSPATVPAPAPVPATPPTPPLAPGPATSEKITVSLDALAKAWPEAVRQEIEQTNLTATSVSIPLSALEAGMKTGRVTTTWAEVRSWAGSPGSSGNDSVSLELPLPVIAPAFMAARRPGASQRKITVGENIPDLFGGLTRPAAPAPSAAAASEPAPAPVVAPPAPDGLGEIFGQPSKHEWSAHELVQQINALPGISAAVMATTDGLMIAGEVPAPWKAETLAGFLPQMFTRTAHYAEEAQLGVLRSLILQIGPAPWMIFQAGPLFIAVLGVPGHALPEAALQRIAGELAKRKP